jgi:hypothetical protein
MSVHPTEEQSAVGPSAGAELAPARPAPPTDRRLYQMAGLGGISATVAWAGQPVVVSLLAGEGNIVTYQTILSHPYLGAIEAVIFAGIGIGLLFLVFPVTELVRRSAAGISVPGRVADYVSTILLKLGATDRQAAARIVRSWRDRA